ncbi:MAG TPA: efflux RND transporter periplasmic adaptor subunit [Vicinamibacterales bacterium]|nr:efflux RND transporter periplasmic adaptor subunit [Vicinamibacterales bacterium]
MRIAALLPAALLCGAAACGHPAPYEKPPTPVVVEAAAPYTEASGVRYSASIEPDVQVDVAFKTGGYVDRLLQVRAPNGRMRDVQAGDRVDRGAVLAALRTADYTTRRRQATAAVKQAQAGLDQATREFERADRLFAAKSETKADRDAAETRRDVARAQLEGAQAAAQEAANALADTELRAPIAGTVMKRLVEVGSLAAPGTPGFVLADTRHVKVVFGAPDVAVRALQVGAPQAITALALPGRTFHGRISRIAPNADPRSRVFDVEVTIPNPQDLLKVGMVAGLQVSGATSPATAPLVVPLAAVVVAPGDPNGYAVYVVEARDGRSTARVRPVQLGETFGNSIAVTSGVQAGDRVIVRGATIVADGDVVRISQP